MKKLIYIFGGQASGKMTIGEELSKTTGLKLFHNHMTVELAWHFYGFGTDIPELKEKHKERFADMRDRIRDVVFDNVAKGYLEGLICTFVMYFDSEYDWQCIQGYTKKFCDSANEAGEEVDIYCVELKCDIEERHRRNITENRLEKKPSKRNIEFTRSDIDKSTASHRFEASDEEVELFKTKLGVKGYLKIDNTKLSAEEVANKIKENFNL